jgi:hypothetical protein
MSKPGQALNRGNATLVCPPIRNVESASTIEHRYIVFVFLVEDDFRPCHSPQKLYAITILLSSPGPLHPNARPSIIGL